MNLDIDLDALGTAIRAEAMRLDALLEEAATFEHPSSFDAIEQVTMVLLGHLTVVGRVVVASRKKVTR